MAHRVACTLRVMCEHNFVFAISAWDSNHFFSWISRILEMFFFLFLGLFSLFCSSPLLLISNLSRLQHEERFYPLLLNHVHSLDYAQVVFQVHLLPLVLDRWHVFLPHWISAWNYMSNRATIFELSNWEIIEGYINQSICKL